MLTDEKKKEASDSLQSLVEDFNKNFTEWMNETGCRANIGWKYNTNNEAIKRLEIQTIDLEVYRKPPPEYMSLQQGVTMDRSSGKPKEETPPV